MLLEADRQREANSLTRSLDRSSWAVEEVTNWVRSLAEVLASSRREASSSGAGSLLERWWELGKWESWGTRGGRWSNCGCCGGPVEGEYCVELLVSWNGAKD